MYTHNRSWKILAATLFVILTLTLLTGVVLANPASTELRRWVFGSAGAPADGGTITLHGTLGQPVTGAAQGDEISLTGGFWQGRLTTLPTIYLPLLQR